MIGSAAVANQRAMFCLQSAFVYMLRLATLSVFVDKQSTANTRRY
jgi:hypothetical protein